MAERATLHLKFLKKLLRREVFQSFRHSQLVILCDQDCADETHDGTFVWEDADDLGSSFDLAVEPLDGIIGADLCSISEKDF